MAEAESVQGHVVARSYSKAGASARCICGWEFGPLFLGGSEIEPIISRHLAEAREAATSGPRIWQKPDDWGDHTRCTLEKLEYLWMTHTTWANAPEKIEAELSFADLIKRLTEES